MRRGFIAGVIFLFAIYTVVKYYSRDTPEVFWEAFVMLGFDPILLFIMGVYLYKKQSKK